MNRTLRVAIAQLDCRWESVEENLERASAAVAGADADLVVLPEMFATGFSMAPQKIAQPIDGSIVEHMRAVAKESKKALIFSAAIVDNGNYYNRLFFITPDGECQTYDKRHLFRMAGEHNHYRAGSERLVVLYRGFRICPLVCYDLRFPVFSRCRQDYDVLVYVASWPAVRSYPFDTLLRARAIENQCYCVGVNRVGTDPKESYSGGSVVLDFLGKPMAEAHGEQVIVAELSLGKLEEFRTGFPASRDADNFMLLD